MSFMRQVGIVVLAVGIAALALLALFALMGLSSGTTPVDEAIIDSQ
jgi:VIT1/CCC1 family predicted Fe2+/Mn2+ transporter